MNRFVVVVLLLFLGFGVGAEEEFPLKPADISSPRATLNSFMENCTTAYTILRDEGRELADERSRLCRPHSAYLS